MSEAFVAAVVTVLETGLNTKFERRAEPPKTKREANLQEWKKLKAKRLARRQFLRAELKKLGHLRPNRKMTKDKKSGADLVEIRQGIRVP